MSPAERIKERLSIADVVSSYVKLDRAGINLKARCPFHHEKTPSFFVSPERGTYRCFGCGASGDIFSFVEAFEGLDFPGALRLLAERAGIELTFEPSGRKDDRERLFAIMERATTCYERELAGASEAKAYLAGRGLSEETVGTWRIGYAPDEWRPLLEALTAEGYAVADIERAGLVKRTAKGDARFYDTFRGRIMFPVFDTSGRPVAFSGRILAPKDDTVPKYVNSPETDLYRKSNILYGLNRAKSAIRSFNCTIVVEGQMDLVLSHQAGYGNTVALSGTALTDVQLSQLARFSGNLVLACDSDAAGIASMHKSAIAALGAGMDVKIVRLPEDKDPADIVREDPAQWKKAVGTARHVVEYALALALDRGREKSDDRLARRAVSEDVVPLLAAIRNPIDREHFIELIARAIRVPEEAVREQVAAGIRSATAQQRTSALMRTAPALEQASAASGSHSGKKDAIIRKVSAILRWQRTAATQVVDSADVEARLATFGILPTIDDAETERVLFELENQSSDTSQFAAECEELLFNLEEELIRERQKIAEDELRQAESSGDDALVEEFQIKVNNLAKARSELSMRKSIYNA